ncbi:pyridoxamine 5'-phosphate oxidase family protein [Methanococcus voltae]|uniref:Pyridoxamine 5'-phosphate oxidase-related FMN-binding protein n=1 Tax=Methanococcus voltae (strain ATCC BAA-1334 / A3) TaxID=456320 RepID=D7DS27_METV3|nr:pyridoxamine 5'-phosphate oxidase family protein [Methanococcus voltae]MCS3901462.1 putative pyridoxine 5'-phosphate oxidase superfamily flavin-nucleotide-binding protein [Methanococcus voltae]
MVKLNDEMQKALSGLLFLATASKDGIPNVAPMGANIVVDDETLIISDNFMKKTIANIKENPVVAINVADCRACSLQFKGKAEYVVEGEYFELTKKWMAEKMPNIKPKGAVVIKFFEIYSVKPGDDAGKLLETDD